MILRPHRLSLLLALLVVARLVLPPATHGGDAAFEALFAQKAWDTAEADARARLAADAHDLVAASDLARVIIEGNRRGRMEEAVTLLERVIDREPDIPRHYWYLGQALGQLARQAGLGGLGLAGRARRALARAVELEPTSFTYVYALNEFYLDAPGIAGGSVARARAAAQAFAAHDHDSAALLTARVLIHKEDFAAALERIATVAGRDVALVNIVRRNLLTEVGNGFLGRKDYAEALRVFEAVTAEFPNNAAAQLGLGRARLATDDVPGALAALQRARELGDHPDAWYWLGRAHEAANDQDAARGSYRGSLERRDSGKNADEARRRLAALGD